MVDVRELTLYGLRDGMPYYMRYLFKYPPYRSRAASAVTGDGDGQWATFIPQPRRRPPVVDGVSCGKDRGDLRSYGVWGSVSPTTKASGSTASRNSSDVIVDHPSDSEDDLPFFLQDPAQRQIARLTMCYARRRGRLSLAEFTELVQLMHTYDSPASTILSGLILVPLEDIWSCSHDSRACDMLVEVLRVTMQHYRDEYDGLGGQAKRGVANCNNYYAAFVQEEHAAQAWMCIDVSTFYRTVLPDIIRILPYLGNASRSSDCVSFELMNSALRKRWHATRSMLLLILHRLSRDMLDRPAEFTDIAIRNNLLRDAFESATRCAVPLAFVLSWFCDIEFVRRTSSQYAPRRFRKIRSRDSLDYREKQVLDQTIDLQLALRRHEEFSHVDVWQSLPEVSAAGFKQIFENVFGGTFVGGTPGSLAMSSARKLVELYGVGYLLHLHKRYSMPFDLSTVSHRYFYGMCWAYILHVDYVMEHSVRRVDE